MSIYVMTLGELAKKRGESVSDFVKKVQALGFEAGSHAKKLTQEDLDKVISLLDQSPRTRDSKKVKEKELKEVQNPNVLMIKSKNSTNVIAFVDASFNEDGSINIEVISSTEEKSRGETLLEFRKQLGLKLGVN